MIWLWDIVFLLSVYPSIKSFDYRIIESEGGEYKSGTVVEV